MPAFKITASAGIALNLRRVLTGVQAGAGIVVAPAIDALLPSHWHMVDIQNEPTGNSGGFIRVGGPGLPTDASVGVKVETGDAYSFNHSRATIALGNIVLAVSADSTIINVELGG